MIKVAICDDEVQQVHAVKRATETYFSQREESVMCSMYDNAFTFLEEIENRTWFDIVFFDICMPDILGTEIAAEMKRQKSQAEIIFLTTSTDFAVEAFSLGVTHYLVKPYTQKQFEEAMDRAMFNYNKAHSSKIIFKLIGGGIRVIEVDDIYYIESDSHIQTAYIRGNQHVRVRQSQAQLLKVFGSLVPGQFVMPYKGYVVNQKEICVIKSSYIEMCDGKHIPLVKREYRNFQAQYFRYIFQRH